MSEMQKAINEIRGCTVPIGDNLVVIPCKMPDQMSPGGLHLPEVAQKNAECVTGVVAAVGKGKYTNDGFLVENSCSVGCVVVFPVGGIYQGTNEARIKGYNVYVLSEKDVLYVDTGVSYTEFELRQ